MAAPTDPLLSTSVIDHGAVGDGSTDCTAAFEQAVAAVNHGGYATLYVPDGVFGITRPIHVENQMSLALAPSARILALPGFEGEAMIIKGGGDHETDIWRAHDYGGEMFGGVIDGAGQAIIGIHCPWSRRHRIHDMEILNCTAGGLHVGPKGEYETTISHVRISLNVDGSMSASPDAIGLKIDGVSDNHVSQVLVIGYEVGVYATGSSTAFHQVHIWNGRNRPLKTAFHAAGHQDMYSQCQVDTYDDTTFFVDAPFQRFVGCFTQSHNKFGKPDRRVAFRLGERGTHGSYFGNFINSGEDAPQTAFTGNTEGCTILGTLFNPNTPADGRAHQIPSHSGGASWHPPLQIVGNEFSLGQPHDQAPTDDGGQPGELRYVESANGVDLYLRTGQGWRRVELR